MRSKSFLNQSIALQVSRSVLLPFVLMILACCGCGKKVSEPLYSDYGLAGSAYGSMALSNVASAGSVNGTRSLALMFDQAGHKVVTWNRFSKRLDRADCIIWFRTNRKILDLGLGQPIRVSLYDQYEPITDRTIETFEAWLDEEPGRTVIVVEQGFDAEIDYWKQYPDLIGPETEHADWARNEVKQRYKYSRDDFWSYLQRFDEAQACKWYTLEPRYEKFLTAEKKEQHEHDQAARREEIRRRIENRNDPDAPSGSSDTSDDELFDTSQLEDLLVHFSPAPDFEPYDVKKLDGATRWTDDINVEEADIKLYDRMNPAPGAEVLLESEDGVLVTREQIGQGQLLVVANGSFLLNLPLINREHRVLAGRLIDEIGDAGQQVCFLEAEDLGDIEEDEDISHIPLGLKIFSVWPTNWIFVQFVLLGIILIFWRLPIFGRPLARKPDAVSDFDKHIDAFADLLERSADPSFARDKLEQFRRMSDEMEKRR